MKHYLSILLILFTLSCKKTDIGNYSVTNNTDLPERWFIIGVYDTTIHDIAYKLDTQFVYFNITSSGDSTGVDWLWILTADQWINIEAKIYGYDKLDILIRRKPSTGSVYSEIWYSTPVINNKLSYLYIYDQ